MPPKKPPAAITHLEQALAVVAAAAPELRAAGVLRVAVGDLSVELEPAPAPPMEAAPAARRLQDDVEFLNPATFRAREPKIDEDDPGYVEEDFT